MKELELKARNKNKKKFFTFMYSICLFKRFKLKQIYKK